MNKKICKVCKDEKDYSEFHKSKVCIGGVRNVCKKCRSIEKDEYTNRPEVKERARQRYQANKAHFRARMNLHYNSLNGQYHEYKKRAKKAGLEFSLLEEDCLKYYKVICTYCGDTVKNLGIDRVDNKKGYIPENIVACCSRCNFMKHIMNKQEFLEHILKIVEHLNLK